MSSTVYLNYGGFFVDREEHREDPTPFELDRINTTRIVYTFIEDDLATIPGNQETIRTNDALWAAIRRIFLRQRRFTIKILFTITSSPGTGISINVWGPFLQKLKGAYEDFNTLKLNLTIWHQKKSWSIDIGLNTLKRQGGVLRIVHSERSERLFRRIANLPGLKMTMKLTTRENFIHTRRVMTRKLVAENIPDDFYLISENGTKIGFHKELLAAHSTVFSCPSVQSMDSFQLFVSDDLLVILKNYLYAETLVDFKQNQQMVYELLEAAHFYSIAGLERIMKKKLMALFEEPGAVGVDMAIFLYFFANKVEFGYEELGAKALALIQNTTRSEIEESEALQFIRRNDEKFGEVVITLGFMDPAEA